MERMYGRGKEIVLHNVGLLAMRCGPIVMARLMARNALYGFVRQSYYTTGMWLLGTMRTWRTATLIWAKEYEGASKLERMGE